MDYHQGMAGPKLPDFIIFLIYGGAIALSAIAAAGSGGDILEVSADGHEYAFSLSEDGFHSFDGPLGETVIEIKDGKARVVSSPCPNGICIKAGWSDTLCCLPNRVIAVSSSEGEADAISG